MHSRGEASHQGISPVGSPPCTCLCWQHALSAASGCRLLNVRYIPSSQSWFEIMSSDTPNEQQSTVIKCVVRTRLLTVYISNLLVEATHNVRYTAYRAHTTSVGRSISMLLHLHHHMWFIWCVSSWCVWVCVGVCVCVCVCVCVSCTRARASL